MLELVFALVIAMSKFMKSNSVLSQIAVVKRRKVLNDVFISVLSRYLLQMFSPMSPSTPSLNQLLLPARKLIISNHALPHLSLNIFYLSQLLNQMLNLLF